MAIRRSFLPATVALMLLASACTGASDDNGGQAGDDRPGSSTADDGSTDGDVEGTDADEDGTEAPLAEPVRRVTDEPLAVASYTEDGAPVTGADALEFEVLRMERVGETIAFDWQLRNTGDAPVGTQALFGAAASYVRGIWLVDGTKQARAMVDEANNCLCVTLGEKIDQIQPGEAKRFRSLHPDLDADTVTVRAHDFEDIEDVPVTEPELSEVTTAGEPAMVVAAANPDITLTVQPLERHGEVAVLRARIENQTTQPFQPSLTRYATDFAYPGRLGTTGAVSFVSGNVHHGVLENPDGLCYCEGSAAIQAGEHRDLVWVYTSPADEVAHVTLNVPYFGMVPGIPVIEADGPLELSFNDTPVEQLDTSGDRRFALISSIEEIDDGVVTRVTERGADSTDIALAADVLFDFDEDRLRPDADPLIDDLVALLEDAGDVPGPVVVEGHTDSIGNADYNLELSERRARSVLAAIEQRLGRDDLAFEVVGRGAEDPVEENTTDEGRQRNRRVTVKIPEND